MRLLVSSTLFLATLFVSPIQAGPLEDQKSILSWLDNLERTDRLWKKGTISGQSEQIRLLKSISELPSEVPDGPLDAAKVTCSAAASSLANAMSSEQSLKSASSPDQIARWQRSLVADHREFSRYAKECRRAANRAR